MTAERPTHPRGAWVDVRNQGPPGAERRNDCVVAGHRGGDVCLRGGVSLIDRDLSGQIAYGSGITHKGCDLVAGLQRLVDEVATGRAVMDGLRVGARSTSG